MAGRRKKKLKVPANDEPAVNQFAAQHGDYRESTVVDLSGELGGGRQRLNKVLRNLYPSVVDRWLAEGGTGFDEPQRRAIDHCRALWHSIGGQGNLVANLDSIGGGGRHCRAAMFTHAEALCQLHEYEKEIPRAYWMAFENAVRNDMPAGRAGSHLARNEAQAIASVRTVVGFVASKIAEWRGY